MNGPLVLDMSYGHALGEHFVAESCGEWAVFVVVARPRGYRHRSEKVAEFKSRLQARRWCRERNGRFIRLAQSRVATTPQKGG